MGEEYVGRGGGGGKVCYVKGEWRGAGVVKGEKAIGEV